MTDLPVPVPTFRIGPLVAVASAVCLRNLPSLLALAILPSLPSVFMLALPDGTSQAQSQAETAAYLLSLPISILLLVFAQGATIQGTSRVLRGEVFDLPRAIRETWWRLPVLTGAGALAGLLIMIGFAALFVPGLMAICVLYVTLPACVIEKIGVVESLERSAELTQGYRIRVFGLFVLAALLVMPLELLFNDLDNESWPIVAALGDEIGTLVFCAFSAVLMTICYEQLYRIKGDSVMIS